MWTVKTDQTADPQDDFSLRWKHMLVGTFSHVVAHLGKVGSNFGEVLHNCLVRQKSP